jgi:N-acetylneuraminate synthase
MKIRSKKNIEQRINKKDVVFDKDILKQNQLASFVHEAKAMLNYNNITINGSLNMEVSHHYGIDKFRKTGCFLFNIINKKYAKKIIVMLPNQNHPWHFHKKKVESFLILFGELELIVRNKNYNLKNGDIFHVKNFSWHKFKAGKSGCIFEEISTTSFKQDSFYKNKKISLIARDKRKTYIDNWFSFSTKKIEKN